MDFFPVNSMAEQSGSRVRLYADPQFVHAGGRWQGIDQALSVQELDGTYRIELGDQWIELRPAGDADRRIIQNASRKVVTPRHFGPVIANKDLASLSDSSLQWRVAASSSVKQTTDGWEFALGENAGGVRLGLYLHDWRRDHGSRLSVVDDLVTLDVADHAGRDGELNLDPTTVYSTANTWAYNSPGRPTWGLARIATSASATGGGTNVGWLYAGGVWTCFRTGIRFDTSGYPSVADVVLKLTQSNTIPRTVGAARCSFVDGLASPNVFTQIKAGYENAAGIIGTFFATAVAGTVNSLTIPVDKYAASAAYDLGLYDESYDRLAGNPPPTDSRTNWFAAGSDAPRLEITLAPPSGGPGGSGTTTTTAA